MRSTSNPNPASNPETISASRLKFLAGSEESKKREREDEEEAGDGAEGGSGGDGGMGISLFH